MLEHVVFIHLPLIALYLWNTLFFNKIENEGCGMTEKIGDQNPFILTIFVLM